jgi:glycosyltransferase involved in cell wall biosynthesis
LFLGLSGFVLSRFMRARWIFNVSDLWPDSAVRLGVIGQGQALKLSEKLEAFCYQKAWAVTGQSRTILQNIQERFHSVHTYHLSNGADTKLFNPEIVPVPIYEKKEAELLAVYAGLHGLAQGLDQILRAAGRFEGKIHFLFVGDGPKKNELIQLAQQMKLRNVTFVDPMLKKHIPGMLAAADICLIPLKSYLPGAVPSKIYESMASGKPILLIAEGEAADIVNGNQAGLTVHPGDEVRLINALQIFVNDGELRKNMGLNGRKAALAKFDRQSIVDRFSSFLQSTEN